MIRKLLYVVIFAVKIYVIIFVSLNAILRVDYSQACDDAGL